MPIKPILPKGTRDFSALEVARRDYLKEILKRNFELFGFQPIETPSFERLETLTGVYGEEGDRLVFKILNSGDKIKKANTAALEEGADSAFIRSISEKALRYDLTVPFARYVAQHQSDLTFPFRRYQIQPVWRADRPQHGRFQEFYQCDADSVGARSLWQEIEMISLYDRVFSELKLEGITLEINHRKILAGVAALLGAESELSQFTIALDKLDKIGKKGVLDELASKGFGAKALDLLENLLALSGPAEKQLEALEILLKEEPEGLEGVNELKFILSQLEFTPLETTTLNFDLSLARGLHYYTGMIIEVSAPEKVKMGSLGGGGRYDDLTGTFGLKEMSGIGISFGFERIYLVMETLGCFPETLNSNAKVLIANFGEASNRIAYECLYRLRKQGISCEFYPTEAKLKKQLAYANTKKIPQVILIGTSELTQNQFVVKNMETGAQHAHPLETLESVLA